MTEETIKVRNSNNVESFGYIPTRSVLFVEFKDGALYEYEKVPPQIFEQMKLRNQSSGSVGSFLHQRVKGYFDARRVK